MNGLESAQASEARVKLTKQARGTDEDDIGGNRRHPPV